MLGTLFNEMAGRETLFCTDLFGRRISYKFVDSFHSVEFSTKTCRHFGVNRHTAARVWARFWMQAAAKLQAFQRSAVPDFNSPFGEGTSLEKGAQ
ncbi:hypothetical protein J4E08_17100 [Sagittula sp. NFXS13]|uniref:hypothetical protein n=1 Tax=Sagittula sp. NFXS13 TaxID=2819095 RepID=UPI0032E02A19